ncbi:MAG: efflux RND transporter permease subunit, partial [Planctomycetaceae bacterium]|nr:efflux RND transporter permease subunit [Planctomycetaceae bacterium]
MSEFFISRPIFAWVIAILIMLAGVLSIFNIPITQYPDLAPPAVMITGMYPGASSQTVQDTVVQIIEQQMTGLDGFRYMNASSTSDGSFTITITFEQGTNPDIAQVQVQNKLQQATPLLPTEVQSQGVSVIKYQTNMIIIFALYVEDDSLSRGDIGDYLIVNFKDTLSRVKGVGAVDVFATQYAMRIWLQPERLYSYNLIPQDVIAAIESQNVQVSSGQIGGLPSPDGTQITATIIAKSRLTTVEQFRNILVKVNNDGSQVRLKDVAAVEMGNENYSFSTQYNGYVSAGMGIRMAPGANILDTTKAIYDAVEKMKPHLPKGMKIASVQEIAPVVRASILSVVETLLEAICLVFLVMFLFLQRFRITLIPMLTVPVVLLGTFAALYVLGFTINIITMFAMVLAIGLLVDDAIVVVENVARIMEEEKLSVKEITQKSMKQIQGVLIGVGLVISAVFFPMAFFGGSTGVIYRQFSITIITAMLLSVLIALTFTPALCASILRPASGNRKTFLLFRLFNKFFITTMQYCVNGVGYVLRYRIIFILIFVMIVAVIIILYPKIPTAFLPVEDQGQLYVLVELPQNATMQRSEAVIKQVSDYFLNEEKETIESVFTVIGFSFAGMSQNSGMVFLALKPFEQRQKKGQDIFSVVERATKKFAQINEARITPIVPPSIQELGEVAGLNFFLQDLTGIGREKLKEAQDQLFELVNQSGMFTVILSNNLPDEPQYRITIDEEKARILETSLIDINGTMSTVWGSSYVNDFVDRGRVKRVYVQGEAVSRTAPEDLDKWYVRNSRGRMVSFSAFSSGEWVIGSPKLARYNGFNGMEIFAIGADKISSGVAMGKVEEIAAKLPAGVGLSFTGLSFEERRSGNRVYFLYGLSILIIFLCLAALYESWSVPAAVLFVVPFGVLGVILATLFRGLLNDVYFQVGMLTVMGLSSKNAILIIEFAKKMYENEGKSLYESAILAARMRLRPIIMTSMVFVLGVIPLTFANGASSVSQHSLGTSV